MKIKAIESIVKGNRNIQIKAGPGGEQWLGDGAAFYPLHGFPKLTEETIFRFFDIPEDKQGKYTYTEGEFPEGSDLRDNHDTDQLLERSEISILDNGVKVLPLFAEDRMIFINEKYLAPFSDEENGVELYERKWSKGSVIAVKTGFLLAGVIAPLVLKNGNALRRIVAMMGEGGDESDT